MCLEDRTAVSKQSRTQLELVETEKKKIREIKYNSSWRTTSAPRPMAKEEKTEQSKASNIKYRTVYIMRGNGQL